MNLRHDELLTATGGKALGAYPDRPIGRIWTDTRTLEPGDVFFALRGEHFDGHNFLEEAARRSAQYLVVEESEKARIPKADLNVILVKDTLVAYADLAKAYRQKFKIPVVAITGSCGKTTTKEILVHLLATKFNILKNRGTENNLIGVPRCLLQLEEAHQVLVIEMGTNRPGEIDRLASIVSPQMGLITQIAACHLEGLKTLDGVREEKMRLIHHLERGGILLLNGEDEILREETSGVHRAIRVGFEKAYCEVSASHVWCHESGSAFHLDSDGFETQLIGRHNVQNALMAVVAAEALGVDRPALKKALAAFKPVPGRLTPKTVEGIVFLDDSYNSNPSSLRAGLETLKSFKVRGRKGVVIGDMLELGEHSEAEHRRIGKCIAEMLFDFVIVAGSLSQSVADEAVKEGFGVDRIHCVKNALEAGKLCRQLAVAGDRVLVKGSRGMRMEKVFDAFEPSVNGTSG